MEPSAVIFNESNLPSNHAASNQSYCTRSGYCFSAQAINVERDRAGVGSAYNKREYLPRRVSGKGRRYGSRYRVSTCNRYQRANAEVLKLAYPSRICCRRTNAQVCNLVRSKRYIGGWGSLPVFGQSGRKTSCKVSR